MNSSLKTNYLSKIIFGNYLIDLFQIFYDG